ncbi:LCP family protein [Paenibacillus eucommiae]|uniref:LCP family protein required for cell wall assembly n=1 Tax=Paenibacillus eucommiae TaxID=1355755 RepID=A0ABS4J5B8_9BACL|nr:LCP family protein [Paenibacillus eucommiae]MBP1993989.1 LCP family protein required for cell wall assembly [Paenibacillus eucommiae]
MAVSVLAGGICLASYLYWHLEPERHFNKVNVPVLALPAKQMGLQLAVPWRSSFVREENNPAEAGALNMGAAAAANPAMAEKADPEGPKAFNVLILGIDARKTESSRSDVMMVMRVVPAERKVHILSLPRDTRVSINGIGYTKINHAHILGEVEGGNRAGTEAAIKAVSNFLDIPINYYMKTNFQGFENAIDAIGGVKVEVEKELYLKAVNVTLHKGTQLIDGEIALGLVRERWAFPDGDFGRQAEQAKILRSVAEELLQPEQLPRVAELLAKIKKDILDTNFTDSDLISLAWLFKGMKSDEFQYKQIPGHGGYETDALSKTRLYYWIPDMEQVKSLKETYLK